MLVHPKSDAMLSLVVEALDAAVGAVLQQAGQEILQRLAFYSRELKTAETRYQKLGKGLLIFIYR